MRMTDFIVKNRAISTVSLILLVSLLSACGQKGPLFLPGEPEQSAQYAALAATAEFFTHDLIIF